MSVIDHSNRVCVVKIVHIYDAGHIVEILYNSIFYFCATLSKTGHLSHIGCGEVKINTTFINI